MAETRARPPHAVSGEPPAEVKVFADWFENSPDARNKFRWVLRDSLDQVLDGGRTGRWHYRQMSKNEKSHLGSTVEVNLTKRFAIMDGAILDWRIAGQELDCKFSKDVGGWEIPMEMYTCPDHGEQSGQADHPALLVWMNDDESQRGAGLLRITDERLRWRQDKQTGARVRGYNRDNKRRIRKESLSEVHWLWGGLQTDLPENILLQLDPADRATILSASTGQQRMNALFRTVRGRLVNRATVLTVGQQDDSPKRARDSRISLRADGVVVLGHQKSDPVVAAVLGLDVPAKGTWISARLAEVDRYDPRPRVLIDGRFWAVAEESDPPVEVPLVPEELVRQDHLGEWD
ncbi:NaeI family type II restriction endonuclease [Actinoplanes rectilineatus]|uniref:NaeI family type II restriction endonuclease n=1 Tax=Actinoplanes rectilineatus TaxID=113571 RepID=UPI0006983E4E|nr:NaeI family type II restriction endonuclease [Actinoplanes rectilineatus]